MTNNLATNQTENNEGLNIILKQHSTERENILPILHDVNRHFGYIPQETVMLLAEHLNISKADVFGVIGFYDDFSSTAPGKKTLQICQAESCQAVGGNKLADDIKTYLGIDFDETTKDGNVTLKPVYCLGNCACSPAVMLDERIYGRVNTDKVKQILAE